HRKGCPECDALLEAMARADAAAGVPDPGPGYWERFNARVADRVARDAERKGAAILRPKGGWVRQQLRYLVPAIAAAALVVMFVRYGALGPGPQAPAVPSTVDQPSVRVPDKAQGETIAEMKPERARQEDASVPRRGPAESGRVDALAGRDREQPGSVVGEKRGSAPSPAPSPAVIDDGRFAFATREERARMEDRASAAKEREASFAREEGRNAAAPPPAPEVGRSSIAQEERRKMAAAEAPTAYPPPASRAETSLAKEVPKDLSAAPPCERARALAARGRWKEAESAQRECLEQDRSGPAQEKGLVFLAELLDRQSRFADADTVIAEVHRQFPRSVPLDQYRQQRPMVQRMQSPPPAGR
ncbi:MAG TPA: hypothetical protein VF853_03525, partial [Candidatus Deferrimicrobiaceae bacterium]